MNKTELKPCPFCGKPATMHTIEPHTHVFIPLPDYGGGTFIECTSCTCAMSAKTEAEAVESWNRRAEITPRCPSNEDVHSSWEEIKDVPHGIWDYHFRCKHCGGNTPQAAYIVAPDYCPNCGAKMNEQDC